MKKKEINDYREALTNEEWNEYYNKIDKIRDNMYIKRRKEKRGIVKVKNKYVRYHIVEDHSEITGVYEPNLFTTERERKLNEVIGEDSLYAIYKEDGEKVRYSIEDMFGKRNFKRYSRRNHSFVTIETSGRVR